jgi:hypothetical protein
MHASKLTTDAHRKNTTWSWKSQNHCSTNDHEKYNSDAELDLIDAANQTLEDDFTQYECTIIDALPIKHSRTT